MYSFPNLEPVRCSMSGSNCCFLTCIQISQETNKVVWCSHLFKNFPQFVVIHRVKGFIIVNEAEVRCFSGTLLLFLWSNRVGNLISCSSAFTKSSLKIWKFSVHILLKPSLENFEHYIASLWDKCKTVVGAKSHLESNPIPARHALRAQTYFVCTRTQRPHRDWDRTVFECLLRRYQSAVDCWGAGALGAVDLGMACPLGGGRQTPPQSHQNLHRTGETDSWRAQT